MISQLDEMRKRAEVAFLRDPKNARAKTILVDVHREWILALDRVDSDDLAMAVRTLNARSKPGITVPVMAAALAVVLEDDKVKEIRKRRRIVFASDAPKAQKRRGTAIEASIVDAVERGNEQLLIDLGQRAIPTLKTLALEVDEAEDAGRGWKALHELLKLSPKEGMDIAVVHATTDDILMKRKVMSVLMGTNPFRRDALWSRQPGEAYQLTDARHGEILLRLVAEPGLPVQRLGPALGSMLERGYAPEPFVPLLVGHLQSFGSYNSNGWPSLGPVFEQLLTSPSVNSRESAVGYFLTAGDLAAARRLSADPSRRVRERALRGFGAWKTYQGEDPSLEHLPEVLIPDIDDRYRADLTAVWNTFDDDSGKLALDYARGAHGDHEVGLLGVDFLVSLAPRVWLERHRSALRSYTWQHEPKDRSKVYSAMLAAIADFKEKDATIDMSIATQEILASASESSASAWVTVARADELGLIEDLLRPQVARFLYGLAHARRCERGPLPRVHGNAPRPEELECGPTESPPEQKRGGLCCATERWPTGGLPSGRRTSEPDRTCPGRFRPRAGPRSRTRGHRPRVRDVTAECGCACWTCSGTRT